MSTTARTIIESGAATLGIELGSTRIKAVLIGPDHEVLATGSHTWENQLVDGYWTYDLDDAKAGLANAYRAMAEDCQARHEVVPTQLEAVGISAMMHGHLAFDEAGELLVPFRTWRNVNAGAAAEELSQLLQINIPMRWSIAHLHQVVLDNEPHATKIAHITTLAGWVHELLSGERVVGIGEASGIFPVDSAALDWDQQRIEVYDSHVADYQLPWKLGDLLPKVLPAGAAAGALTADGAAVLDPTGALQAGARMCPPEGDAGTGMVATNAVAARTGNVSVGTSLFAMLVLERPIKGLHMEIDPVTTPDGAPVAMVHSNNGSSEIDEWVGVFSEFAALAGVDIPKGKIYDLVLETSLKGAADGGEMLAYNLLSGEPVIGVDEGRPLFLRAPGSGIDLATFIRVNLMAMFAPLRAGMDILAEQGVEVDRLLAHGGILATPGVAQKILADSVRIPIAVGTTASEGGAWGIAVLARYASVVAEGGAATLPEYLNTKVFAGADESVIAPDDADATAFDSFQERYLKGTAIIQAAAENS
ncbi:MAG: FGGY-family carbohydrate kinase [Actinomycetaceae bacterium]|nr:FGGY-family carbohydrate kinase [Actinomycetaceae bacterium]